jgi:glycosyltransferase involved in cell wall biosynthesis
MKRNATKISICIPTFNQAHFLSQAMASVLAQTYADFELIVADNCSTDNTRQVVEGFMARDKRVRYYRNEENIGAQRNLNRCLHHASGEYVKLLCTDDLIEPTCLEKSVEVLDANPFISLVATARLVVTENMQVISTRAYSSSSVLTDSAPVVDRCLAYGNLIGEPAAVFFRRRQAVRGFNEAYTQLIDLEMWFYLLEQGTFAFLSEPLCKIRTHPGQLTQVHRLSFQLVDDEFRLFEEYGSKPDRQLSRWKRFRAKYRTVVPIWDMLGSTMPQDHLRQRIIRHYGRALYAILIMLKRIALFIFRR